MAIKYHRMHDAVWEKDGPKHFGRQPCNHNEGGVKKDRAKQGIDAKECRENV